MLSLSVGLCLDLSEKHNCYCHYYCSICYNSKGVHYSEYIDMESFAGIYTIQELMKNWDAYLSSMFFFKDADKDGQTSKIYMGPLWDLDNTLGNINFNKEFGTDTAYLWAQNGVFQKYSRDFAKKLMSHEDFQAVVADQFDTAYLAVQDYLAENGWIAETVEDISDAVAMDRTLWKLYSDSSWLLNSNGRKQSVKFVQFEDYGTPMDNRQDTAVGFMRYYLSARVQDLVALIGHSVAPTPKEPTPQETTTDLPVTQETTTVQTEQTIETAQSTNESSEVEQTTTAQTTDTEIPTDPDSQLNPIVIVAIVVVGAVLIGGAIVLLKKKK